MERFAVYAEAAEEVKKKLDRLAKKAAGYEIPFSYTVSEEHPEVVRVMDAGPDGTVHEVNRYTVAAVDFVVECDGLIKANGWTVCAKIEHGEKGNIVTGFGGHPVLPEWYSVDAGCDHCHVKRPRSVTFMCENEQGEYRQVGRTCLKDYTGISPATTAMWAEVRDLMAGGMDCMIGEWESRNPAQMYDVRVVLAHAYDVVKEFGYRKSDELNSTREMATDRVLDGKEPSAEGLSVAQEIVDWLITMDVEGIIGPERDCVPLVQSGYAKRRHFGRLAYMPVALKRHKERAAREAKREADRQMAATNSKYVGAVGERLSIKVAAAQLLTSWDGYYGTTWLYKFTDESGNEFVWYASRPCDAIGGEVLKATVKDHKERDGVKQTIITRCSVAA